MTRSDLTHLYFLLDRSGSMQSIKSDIEGGFAAFVDEQRKAPGDCLANLVAVRRRLRGRLRRPAARRRTAARPAAAQHDRPARRDGPADHRRRREARRDPRGRAAGHRDRRDHDRRPGERQQGVARARRSRRSSSCRPSSTAGSSSTWAPTRTPSRSAPASASPAANSITYAKGKAREAMAMSGGKISGLRAHRMADPAAAMPAFTERGAAATWPSDRYLGGIRMPPSTRTTSAFM